LARDALLTFIGILPITVAGEGRMRTFILALVAIVPAFAIERARAVDEIPAFDIVSTGADPNR
jgi:hypothetical protein